MKAMAPAKNLCFRGEVSNPVLGGIALATVLFA
jgi:hypothetical protein